MIKDWIKKIFVQDGIENVTTGLGGAKDQKTNTSFTEEAPLTQKDIEIAYRYNDVFANAIDIVANDCTSKFIETQADIKGLDLKGLSKKIVLYVRLYGEAIVIVENAKMSLKSPVNIDKEIKEVHIYHKFNAPSDDIHESRILSIKNNIFGDSLLHKVKSSILNLATSLEIPASLMHRADFDFLSIKGLSDALMRCKNAKNGTNCEEVESKIRKRIQTMYESLSMYHIGVKDADEKFENFSKNLNGFDTLQTSYMYAVAGATQIPATRLFGRSPAGMNATGESDLENYQIFISSQQTTLIAPFLNFLFPNMTYSFPRIYTPTMIENADMELKKAQILALFKDDITSENFSKAIAKLSVFDSITLDKNEEEV
jgi:hypothetical protein